MNKEVQNIKNSQDLNKRHIDSINKKIEELEERLNSLEQNLNSQLAEMDNQLSEKINKFQSIIEGKLGSIKTSDTKNILSVEKKETQKETNTKKIDK